MGYIYSVIRYVPNPTIGEFVNLGIIVGSDTTGEWEIAWPGNRRRARNLNSAMGTSSYSVVQTVMQQTKARLQLTHDRRPFTHIDEPTEPFSESWLQRMHANSANIIQYTRPLPIAAPSVSAAISRITQLLFVTTKAQRRPVNKAQIVGNVRQALNSALADRRVETRLRVTLEANGMTETSDLIAFDDTRLLLTCVWSFTVSQDTQARLLDEIKALALFCLRLRQGRDALTVQTAKSVEQHSWSHDSPLAVVLHRPSELVPQDIFQEATHSLTEASVPQYFAHDIDPFTHHAIRHFNGELATV